MDDKTKNKKEVRTIKTVKDPLKKKSYIAFFSDGKEEQISIYGYGRTHKKAIRDLLDKEENEN